MKAAELRRWLNAHTLTQRAVAERLGIHEVTLSNWVHGRQPMPKWVALALVGLDVTLRKGGTKHE